MRESLIPKHVLGVRGGLIIQMPEQEITQPLKEKKTESLFRKIKPTWIAAGIFGLSIFLIIYSNSSQLRELVQQNMMIMFIVGMGAFYIFTKSQEPESVIGNIKGQILLKNYVHFQQEENNLPEGEVFIRQSKRRSIGRKPENYYYVVDIETERGLETWLGAVDSKDGDVVSLEPRIGGVTKISEEMKDIIPEKRIVTEEVEEIEGG